MIHEQDAFDGFDGFESYASEQDGDTEQDHQIRSVFNNKNVQLIEKNQELLDRADDERNEKIRDFVEENNVLIPIAPIQGGADGLHLIGTARAFVEVIDDEPHVRVGGGFQTLKEYHDVNKKHFKGVIVSHMQNSNLQYEEVVDGLLSG